MSKVEKDLLIKLIQDAKKCLVTKNYVVLLANLNTCTDILADEKEILKDQR